MGPVEAILIRAIPMLFDFCHHNFTRMAYSVNTRVASLNILC